MSALGIFVDRCASAPSVELLSVKMGVPLPPRSQTMKCGDVIWNRAAIVMRNPDGYMGIIRGGRTILSDIISELVLLRKESKMDGDTVSAWCCKILLVSIYGAMGSKHGVLSSKTCAQITTYAARYYLKSMVECAKWCGSEVIYGDTDSIFCAVRGSSETECLEQGEKIKAAIVSRMSGTVFEGVGADVKGNYMSEWCRFLRGLFDPCILVQVVHDIVRVETYYAV